jgi:predicted nucleic acid-binding Zn ribbon protein
MNQRKNEAKLGDILNALRADPRYKAKLYQKQIENGWQDLMGVWINRETRSIRVRDGELTIKIASSALREELDFMRDQIKEKINVLVGEDYIKKVVIR